VVSYVHNAAAPGMGKIGVLVAFTGGDEGFGPPGRDARRRREPRRAERGRARPGVVEKEKQVQMDIARESGKPEQVIEKMIEGRMKKFLAEVTLLNQQFVVNPDLTVAAAAKEAGVEITGFVRLEVGEGIEVEKEDFAAEVAKAAGTGTRPVRRGIRRRHHRRNRARWCATHPEPGCGCRDATMAPLDPMFLAVNCHHSRNGFTLRCALGIR
jgi:hypothetical protein